MRLASSALIPTRRPAALGWVLGIALVAAPMAADSFEAAQGSVAGWAGEAESCGMDGRAWKALDGDCWYPIDFQRPPSTVEIARWLPGGGMERAWLKIVEQDFGDQDIDFPDESLVHLSSEDAARLWREQAQIKPLFLRRGDAQFTLPIAAPADPLPEGRYFGVSRTFNGVPKNAHTGTDYAIALGTPTLAVADGTVVLTGEFLFAGRSVFLDHGDGLISMYFHLDEITVTEGDTVSRGDTIGKIGSTGRSTGPHLHLGLRWKGARIDPEPLIGNLDGLPMKP
ncbi:MAG: M23 family metallopeptidase [Acidobacteriota bacterium]